METRINAFIRRWAWLIVMAGWIGLLIAYVKIVDVVLHGEEIQYVATAYCKGTNVAVGMPVKRGMAASDPRILPLGSIIRVYETGDSRWDGIYHVVDTGPEIQGHEIDLYSWSCYEALDFGRRKVKIEVLRYGWMPNERVTR